MVRAVFFVLVGFALAFMVSTAASQDSDSRQRFRAVNPDSSLAGYRNPTIAGPGSAEGTLEFDSQEKKSQKGILPVRLMAPWYAKKAQINERYGLQFGLNYQLVYAWASAGITPESETQSASGVVNIPISWTPIGRNSRNKGTFTIAFENRHVYGFDVSPQNLAFETGTILPTAVKFGDVPFRVLVMHYYQALFDGRFGFVVGKIAADDYFSHHQLMHPFLNYLGFGSIISPSGNWINPGFGIAAGVAIKQQFFIKAGLLDADGDPFNNSEVFDFGNDFWDGRFTSIVEAGWAPSHDERYAKRAAITAWHTDPHDSFEEGYGVAFAGNWTVGERWVPILLAGASNGKGISVLAERTLTLGLGYNFAHHDVFGSSFNWTRPPGGLRDQYTTELYYRFYLSERMAFTPNIQWVINPSLNTAESSMIYLQIRARFDV